MRALHEGTRFVSESAASKISNDVSFDEARMLLYTSSRARKHKCVIWREQDVREHCFKLTKVRSLALDSTAVSLFRFIAPVVFVCHF